MSEPYIKTEAEYLAELLATDPVIKGLDEKIVERKATKKDDVLKDLMKEKRQALAKVSHAAKSLANVIFKIQGARLMVRSRASVKELLYEKQKRVRYLKSQARVMKEDAAKKASSLYYRKVMANKKVSPPEQA